MRSPSRVVGEVSSSREALRRARLATSGRQERSAQLRDAHLVGKREQAVGGRGHGYGCDDDWIPFVRYSPEFIAVSGAVATGCDAGFNQLPTRLTAAASSNAASKPARLVFWRNRSPGRSGRYTRAEQRCGHLSRDFRVIARGLERRNVLYTDWRGAAANRSLRAAVSPYKLVTRFIGAPLLLSRSEPVAWAFGRIVLHQILCRCYAVDIRPPDRLSQIGVAQDREGVREHKFDDDMKLWHHLADRAVAVQKHDRIIAGKSGSRRCTPGICHFRPTNLRPSRVRNPHCGEADPSVAEGLGLMGLTRISRVEARLETDGAHIVDPWPYAG